MCESTHTDHIYRYVCMYIHAMCTLHITFSCRLTSSIQGKGPAENGCYVKVKAGSSTLPMTLVGFSTLSRMKWPSLRTTFQFERVPSSKKTYSAYHYSPPSMLLHPSHSPHR